MKAHIFALGLIVAASPTLAQPEQGHRDEHRARLQQELELSDEQIQQMQDIREQGGSREDMHAILTEEQREKAEQLHTKHAGNREKRTAKMKEYLNLSDEQVQEMKAIREQGGSREEVQAVLTDEQKTLLAEKRKHHGKKPKQ